MKKVIKQTTKEIICDLCGNKIPFRGTRTKNSRKCMICKKDVCYRCKYILIKNSYPSVYKFVSKRVGVVCIKCFPKKVKK